MNKLVWQTGEPPKDRRVLVIGIPKDTGPQIRQEPEMVIGHWHHQHEDFVCAALAADLRKGVPPKFQVTRLRMPPAPVLVHPASFEVRRRSGAAGHVVDERYQGGPIVLVDELGERSVDDVLRAVAKDSLDRWALVRDPQIDTGDGDGVGRVLHQGPEPGDVQQSHHRGWQSAIAVAQLVGDGSERVDVQRFGDLAVSLQAQPLAGDVVVRQVGIHR